MKFGLMVFSESPPLFSLLNISVKYTLLKCFGKRLERSQGGNWVAMKYCLQPPSVHDVSRDFPGEPRCVCVKDICAVAFVGDKKWQFQEEDTLLRKASQRKLEVVLVPSIKISKSIPSPPGLMGSLLGQTQRKARVKALGYGAAWFI